MLNLGATILTKQYCIALEERGMILKGHASAETIRDGNVSALVISITSKSYLILRTGAMVLVF